MSRRYEELSAQAWEDELTLSWKGMSSVNWDCSDSDFEFVFGEDRVCRVHSVLAEFLSPKVARVRKCDPFYSFYTFKDSALFSAFESLVLSLRAGEALQVGTSNWGALLGLSQDLENSELLSLLIGMIKPESLSLEDAIVLLRDGIALGTAVSAQLEKLRDFVARHFYKVKKEVLDNLDLETAQFLLSSPSLQVEDEDSLYDFVRSRSAQDLRFASLFEFVYFKYLSVNRIENVSSFVSENLLENISSGIWRQICRRLILEAKANETNPRATLKFVYNGSYHGGIIEHLQRECGGNVHDKGIVNVTASSVVSSDYLPKSVVSRGDFYTQNQPDQWICYDFKHQSVSPTSYSVRSCGSQYPKNWVIEVSNDGSSWTEIDRRSNNDDLNNSYNSANFKIANVPSESYRFFRLRQTGKNSQSYDTLRLAGLEIFGTLFQK